MKRAKLFHRHFPDLRRDKCNFRTFPYQRVIFIRECKLRNISQINTMWQALASDPTRLSVIIYTSINADVLL